jgi:hypothetical protein
MMPLGIYGERFLKRILMRIKGGREFCIEA